MDFILRSDARARVLKVTFRKSVTDDRFLAAFAAVKDFVAQRGPYHGITDFSEAGGVEISNGMLDYLGGRAPAFPVAMRRIVVAPTPEAHVSARVVQRLRSGSSAPIEITATTEEAYLGLGTNASDLIVVPAFRSLDLEAARQRAFEAEIRLIRQLAIIQHLARDRRQHKAAARARQILETLQDSLDLARDHVRRLERELGEDGQSNSN